MNFSHSLDHFYCRLDCMYSLAAHFQWPRFILRPLTNKFMDEKRWACVLRVHYHVVLWFAAFHSNSFLACFFIIINDNNIKVSKQKQSSGNLFFVYFVLAVDKMLQVTREINFLKSSQFDLYCGFGLLLLLNAFYSHFFITIVFTQLQFAFDDWMQRHSVDFYKMHAQI